jgi:hypothetical protein
LSWGHKKERKILNRFADAGLGKTDSVACTRKFGSTEHEQNQVGSKPCATSSPAFSSPHFCSAAGRHLFLAWKFPSKTPRCTAGQRSTLHLVDEADGRVLLPGAPERLHALSVRSGQMRQTAWALLLNLVRFLTIPDLHMAGRVALSENRKSSRANGAHGGGHCDPN